MRCAFPAALTYNVALVSRIVYPQLVLTLHAREDTGVPVRCQAIRGSTMRSYTFPMLRSGVTRPFGSGQAQSHYQRAF